MRKYQPLWTQIRDTKTVSLTAPVESHARIINAVRKEKSKDLGWKLMMAEQGLRYKMLEKVAGTVITFYLEDDSPASIDSL